MTRAPRTRIRPHASDGEGRTRLSEDERRHALLRAARAIAVDHGLVAVTAAAVAVEAGVSKGLVFFHFGDTDGLVMALADAVVEEFIASFAGDFSGGAVGGALHRLEHLDAAGRASLVQLLLELWVAGRHKPGLKEVLAAGLARARGAIASEVGGDVDDARVALTLLFGASVQALVAAPADLSATARALRAAFAPGEAHALSVYVRG